ncbi:MAG: ammonium transporter [Rikenellaceae bacterium]
MEEIIVDSLATACTAPVAEATANVADLVAGVAVGLDTVWVLLAAMLVFIMQAGFALVEAGFTRTKNTANILMKNFLDFSVGSLFYWALGFGIMFGAGNMFIGEFDFLSQAFLGAEAEGLPNAAVLVFQTMFCATAATIVSGAVAERTKFSAYLIYSVLIFAVVYPISGHWSWGGGWLGEMGFIDFAGSAIVHSVGGWLAMIGAIVLGPRIGKYKNGKPKAIPGHNLTAAALGVFLLWFGWFGFNPGSQVAASTIDDATAISDVFLTTNLAAAAGGVFALILAWVKYGKPSLSLTLNGVLAGLVGITAGCADVSPLGAFVIGAICGLVMVFAVDFFEKTAKIDDPVGAVSVHGVCGTLGTILTGVLATDGGLLYGGGSELLITQTIGAFAYMGWAIVMGIIIFKGIDLIMGMRVEARIEEEGLDIYEHGESAYN